MKKRVLIFSHAMEIGGAERALLGLLETIDTEKYHVDLFLMRHEGELMKYIPEQIHLLPELPQYACLAVPLDAVMKKRQFAMAFGRLVGKKMAARRAKKLNIPADNDIALMYSHKFTLPFVPKISDKQYDLAISFLTPHYFVAEKVQARKKIAWIHTDYSTVAVDREDQVKMWAKYDYIASISDRVTETFLKTFPSLSDKVCFIPNIMPIQYVRELTDEFIADSEMQAESGIRLLSVGRFCKAKNFDNVPDICSRLLSKGLNVRWYLIGYGGDEQLIRRKIEEAGMQEHVIILGKKENPYPYIKACDIYVQPSRYEGKCVAVIEAQCLHKPVIITNYATSGSQLKDGYDGIVVPMDNEGCAEGIAGVIRDTELQRRLIENVKQEDYTNASQISILYRIMEEPV